MDVDARHVTKHYGADARTLLSDAQQVCVAQSSRRGLQKGAREGTASSVAIVVVVCVFPTGSFSIAELFSGPFLFNIPLYQRPYSWGREQAERLLEDLTEAAGIGGELADPEYFLGTVLLMDQPGVETDKLTLKMSSREFDVVDGQQRLATLMTLFAVLRDFDAEPKSAIAKRAQSMITARRGGRFRRTERFRLHLASRDRGTFEESVLQPGSTMVPAEPLMGSPSEEQIIAVRDYFRRVLAELGPLARRKLFEFVADHCYVVVIVSHDIDRAHRTFVVLNGRGRPLQRNDILKADLLKGMSAGDIAWATPMWDGLSAELGNNFEDFFGLLRTALGYTRPQIVTSIREMVRDAGGSEPFIKQILLPHARSYSLICKGGSDLPSQLRVPLQYLNRLAEGDWAPAAILAMKSWQEDPQRAEFLLAEIDRLAHAVRLLCSGAGKRVRRFNDIVAAIRSGEVFDAQHPVVQLTREEQRSIGFHLRDIAKRNTKLCKLVLLRINDEMTGGMSSIDPNDLTVEHVLPQRPSTSSNWHHHIPNADQRAKLVQNLGNLVLIPRHANQEAQNASFDAKQEIYARALSNMPQLEITKQVLLQREWGAAQIEERERELLSVIEKLWRLDLRGHRSPPREPPPPKKLKGARSPT